MSRTHLHSPSSRGLGYVALVILGASSVASCSGSESSTRAGGAGGAAGKGGAGGSAGSSVASGGSAGMLGSGGTLGTSGSGGSGGGGGLAGGSAGTGGSGGAGGSAGNAGSAGKGGTGGTGGSGGTTVMQPTGCEAEAAGAGGTGGASGASGAGAGGAPASPCEANPLTDKTTWTATASHNAAEDLPAEAIDAVAGTRFSTGKDQDGDEWLQIDFGASVTISRVEITTTDTNDYASMFELRVSDTPGDTAATPVASGTGGAAITRCFTPATGRYLLISQTGTSNYWWSVHDVAVACE